MNAEIIAIGDELTSGQRLDTNSHWISQRLGDLGARVTRHVTVADDLAANVDVFRRAIEGARIVIATGGLGPTADDLTREAIAQALGVELRKNELALAHIRALFARRGRPMPERNETQAFFPEGARMVDNPHGTAPGISLDAQNALGETCRVIALPGVPAELFEMWEASVAQEIAEFMGAKGLVRHYRVKCFGVGESDLEQMLPDLIRRGREPSVGITVSEATITLRITTRGANEEACLAAVQPTLATIHECLGTLVFGAEDDELEHAVTRLLREKQKTLVTHEIGTAGLIANWLGEVAGAAEFWRGGWFTPDLAGTGIIPAAGSNDADSSHTGSRSTMLADHAGRLRASSGADFALVVGPFPRQDHPGDDGLVRFALASSAGTETRATPFAGHPAIQKPRAAKQALNFLRLTLLGALTEPGR